MLGLGSESSWTVCPLAAEMATRKIGKEIVVIMVRKYIKSLKRLMRDRTSCIFFWRIGGDLKQAIVVSDTKFRYLPE